jgi:hypothetical protein
MLADDESLAPLWQAVYARLCAGEAAEAIATVRVPGLPRAGVATLRSSLDTTPRRRRGRSAVMVTGDVTIVPLRELLRVLGLDPANLPTLVERAVGTPVVDRAAAARAAAARRVDLWEYAAARLPQVPRLLARMRAAGVGAVDTDVRRTVDALAAALPQLPARPPVSLAKSPTTPPATRTSSTWTPSLACGWSPPSPRRSAVTCHAAPIWCARCSPASGCSPTGCRQPCCF